MGRFAKLFGLVIGAIVVILIVSVASYLIMDYRSYQKVAITAALLRDGVYDPAAHFTFDRACVFPTESLSPYAMLPEQGYREIDPIFPDSHTNWMLVLIDDKNRAFRILYILEPKVKLGGGIGCSARIVLRTKTFNGEIIADAEQSEPIRKTP